MERFLHKEESMIKLFNRDGLNLWLEKVSGNFYAIKSDEESKWGLEHLRVGLEDNKNRYSFVDPSGGPFLSVGHKLKDDNGKKYIIKEISRRPFLFTLEELI